MGGSDGRAAVAAAKKSAVSMLRRVANEADPYPAFQALTRRTSVGLEKRRAL
jgi:hypothetical protein